MAGNRARERFAAQSTAPTWDYLRQQQAPRQMQQAWASELTAARETWEICKPSQGQNPVGKNPCWTCCYKTAFSARQTRQLRSCRHPPTQSCRVAGTHIDQVKQLIDQLNLNETWLLTQPSLGHGIIIWHRAGLQLYHSGHQLPILHTSYIQGQQKGAGTHAHIARHPSHASGFDQGKAVRHSVQGGCRCGRCGAYNM